MLKDLIETFNPFSSPDKMLVRSVLARDLPGVRKAFERGASPDAVHDYRFRGNGLVGRGHVKDPVIITAIKTSSLEIVEEILKHRPDSNARRWCSQDGVTGYLKKDLLTEAEEQASLREDEQAKKKIAVVKAYLHK